MKFDDLGTVLIVVSRREVESGDTSGPLSILMQLVASQQMVRDFRTRVDISFDGYNETEDELFEILEVRDYVHAMDLRFPYWLYFLSRDYTGLHCITLCFLTPYLTNEARAKTHPLQLADLFERRWGPALTHICAAAGIPAAEADDLIASALDYYESGPFRRPQ